MKRRPAPGSFVRTAPSTGAFPWETIWRWRDGIRVNLGKVFKIGGVTAGNEMLVNRFPSKRQKTLTTSPGRMMMHTIGGDEVVFSPKYGGANAARTGSLIIHQKATFGRCLYAQAIPCDAQLGFGYWRHNQVTSANSDFYVILHEEFQGNNSRWCLSLVTAANLLDDDIKIAYVSNTDIIQLWKSDIFIPDVPDIPEDPPVVQPPVVEPDPNDPTTHVTVKAFMVNNLVPVIDDGAGNKNYLTDLPAPALQLNFDPNGYSYIYLRVGCDYSVIPHVYPVVNVASALYPEVISSDIQLTSDDDYGYILIAVVRQGTPNVYFSFVNSSLWSDRIKVANADATYYFSRV